jgi:predicted kinase
MQELVLCRGIPASGKSTWAKTWVTAGENRVRVNRDDIRMQMFGKPFGVNEFVVTKVEDAMVLKALKCGMSVVVDDTNIKHEYVKRFASIADMCGVPVQVKTFDIELDEAIRRNQARADAGGAFVPVDVIQKMHQALRSSGEVDLTPPVLEPYTPLPNTVKAVLVDIDGTLADMGDRSPYDWASVHTDTPHEDISELVRMFADRGFQIIVMSGRDGSCREATMRWLDSKNVWWDRLFMRAAGDMRKDAIVKRELFDEHVRYEYNVKYVLDDRQQVVDMWRAMGLRVLQVAPGDF